MKRVCAATGEAFEVTAEDLSFYDRVGPTFGDQHFSVTPPTLSPNERLRRKLAFRSEREFYRNTCAITGKPLLSVYSPDKSVRICDKTLWLDVDNRECGREFDFSRPFFDQFAELFAQTIKPNIVHAPPMVNSEYSHFCGNLKNGFMCFDSGQSEDLAYAIFTGYSRDSVDTYYLLRGELCYEVVKGEDCYTVFNSTRCQNCNFSAFLYDCIGCSHCIGCVNLRHKEYYIFNKPVDRVTFDRVWKELCGGSYRTWRQFQQEFETHRLRYPHRAVRNIQAEGCIGDDLTNCEEVYNSYNCFETRKLRHCHDLYLNVEDTYDFASWGEGAYRCYEMTGSGGLEGKVGMSGCLFSAYIFYGGYNVLYSLNCLEKCQNLFGCTDLRRQEYCVLNKQYSRDEYEALVPKIIQHMRSTNEWGAFFPMSLSPFGYNETIAMEEFPLTRAEALERGAKWSDYQPPTPKAAQVFSPEELPDNVHDGGESICDAAIQCESTGRLFRLTRVELAFYRKLGLPLPRRCFQRRHLDRRARLNPRKLWERHCAKTGESILTSFAPDRPEIVYSARAFEDALE